MCHVLRLQVCGPDEDSEVHFEPDELEVRLIKNIYIKLRFDEGKFSEYLHSSELVSANGVPRLSLLYVLDASLQN